jgi:hypothetical protein
MTTTKNILWGTTTTLVHLTDAPTSTAGQQGIKGICGRTVRGYSVAPTDAKPATCPKCLRTA